MRRQKRKFRFKKMAIALAFILCNCFLITAMAEPYSQANNSKKDKINKELVENNIKNSKTATPTGVEGEYEIELKVSGTSTTVATPVDIVMIVDTSTDMKPHMEKLKKAMKEFTDKIFDKDTGVTGSKISIVDSASWAYVLQDFSSNPDTIKGAIDNLHGAGNKNTQHAWQVAGDQLDKARENANKYVLFFTDGLPLKSEEGAGGNVDHSQYAKKAYDDVLRKHSSMKAYSIGLMEKVGEAEKEKAKEFLEYVKNEEAYFIGKGDTINLSEIYDKIAESIKKDTSMANDAIITDEVTTEFEIVNGGADTKVYKPLEGGKLEELPITPTVNGNKLSWNLGNVGTEGRIIRFKIRLKDEYYGIGDDKIPTNVEATMGYTDKSGKKQTITFEKPTVNVPYKKGKITVIKEVKNNTGLTAPKDDNFNVSLIGKGNIGEYSVELKDGETKTLNFTLKHNDANVSAENLKSKDFLNIGEYDIREIVPMNYELEDIYVDGVKVDKNNRKFTINNANNNITIKVVNKYVNDKYFYDKAEEKNVLQLKK